MTSLSSYRKPDSNFTMGMELECFLNRDNLSGVWDGIGAYYGFWYAANDGSITPDHYWRDITVEFVSMPVTTKWLKKEIKKLWGKFQWKHNDSCGIHIHINRKWLNEKKAKAIYKFYCSLSTEQQQELFGRASNSYCRMENWNTTRYNAVNNENKATIELRMFASGDYKWAQYCADMADYLVRNANRLNIDAVYAARDLFLS